MPDAVAGGACKLIEVRRVAGGEEHGVSGLEAELALDRGGTICTDVLGDGSGACGTFLFTPEDVAEPRLSSPWAQEFMRSQNARLPPVGAGMAHTRTFGSFSIMPAKT